MICGCVILIASAIGAAVSVIQHSSNPDIEIETPSAHSAAKGRHRHRHRAKHPGESGSREGRKHSRRSKRHRRRRRQRSKTPTVVKQQTALNNAVNVDTVSLANDIPVTVMYEDTGEKFSAI